MCYSLLLYPYAPCVYIAHAYDDAQHTQYIHTATYRSIDVRYMGLCIWRCAWLYMPFIYHIIIFILYSIAASYDRYILLHNIACIALCILYRSTCIRTRMCM